MKVIRTLVIAGFFTAMVLGLLSASLEAARPLPGLKGWELDSPYQKLYRPDRYESFKGTLVKIIDIVPLPGMAKGEGLLVRTRKGKTIEVQLGPKAFVNTSVIHLQQGDHIKCLGVRAKIRGREVFIASKIKKSEYVQMKLRRTADGVPFWAMTIAELADFTADLGSSSQRKAGRIPQIYTIHAPLHYENQSPRRYYEDRQPTDPLQ